MDDEPKRVVVMADGRTRPLIKDMIIWDDPKPREAGDYGFPKCKVCGRTKVCKLSMSEPSCCQTTGSRECKGAAITRGRAAPSVKVGKIDE